MALNEQEELELLRLKKQRALAKTSPAPQEKSDFGEKAYGLGYGAATGTLGALGDIEKLGAYTVPEFFGAKPTEDKWTVFPTTEKVRQYAEKAGIPRPSQAVSGYVTGGELAPALLSLPSLARKGTEIIAGKTAPIVEDITRQGEKLGFKFSAPQVRRETPTTQYGATGFEESNQNLANRYASKATGKESPFVDEAFIKSRLKDLGSEFDKIYKGNEFRIDEDAIKAIQQIADSEAAAVGKSGVSAVENAARDIASAAKRLGALPGAVKESFAIKGEGLQRLRNALAQKAASASGVAKHEIYNLIDEVDASIARNHPEIATALNDLRSKYRASAILEDLTSRGGIDAGGDISLNRLGEMLRGTSIRRREEQAIDFLGKLGRATNLISLGERAGEAVSETGKAAESLARSLGVSTLGRIITSPTRARAVRALQRYYAKRPQSKLGKILSPFGTVIPAGEAARKTDTENK